MVTWLGIAGGLLIISLVGALSAWLVREWVWKPWQLILFCRKQGISGYPFIPFVGQLPQISEMLERPKSGDDWEVLRSAQQCVEKHGKVFYFTTGKTVRICISDPDLLKDILTNNSDSYAKPSFVHVLGILGDGLFRANGEVWSKQRRLLGLCFANKEIKTQIGNIVSIAQSAVEKWFSEVDSNSGELGIYRKLLQFTLNVIENLAFGVESAVATSTGEESSPLVTRAFDRYLHNCRNLVFGLAAAVPGYQSLPTRSNRQITEDQEWLLSFVNKIIEARSSSYASSPAEAREHTDVLDMMLGAVQTKDISSQQLRDNSVTILLAGHHTTASLLSWTMYMLALHPTWQEKARAEVQELSKDGGEVEWATLSGMKTIAMVLQETLRMYPPVPLIGRLCLKENSVGPYTIPEGVEILIPTAVIHRDKGLWGEDADEYNPMRFAKGISKACKHVMGYLPFGNGPRTCIGQTLALAEAKAALAVMLGAFSWRIGPGYRHCPDISLTLQPMFDIPLIVEKLENS